MSGEMEKDGKTKSEEPKDHWWFKGFLVGLCWVTILVGVGLYFLQLVRPNRSELEVIATAHQLPGKGWEITGQIRPAEAFTNSLVISVMVTDDRGHGFLAKVVTNSPAGEFTVSALPELPSGTNSYFEAIIQARVMTGSKLLESKAVLLLTRDRVRAVRIADLSQGLAPLVIVFLGSVMLALVTPRCLKLSLLRSAGYYGSLLSALALTVMMVTYIGGVTKMNELCRPGEVLSVGFASIHEGTYLKDGGKPEWILSFTETPREIAMMPATLRGFGAPLWVIFIAALGSGLYTILIIIRGIAGRKEEDAETAADHTHEPDGKGEEDSKAKNGENKQHDKKGHDAEIQGRMKEILLHQFYILFSPIGAIFVYQTLITTEMAGQPVTIALVALAAGISMSYILDRAVVNMERLFSANNPPGGPPGGPPGKPGAGGAHKQGGSAISNPRRTVPLGAESSDNPPHQNQQDPIIKA